MDQLRAAAIQLVILAFVGGVGTVTAIIGYFIRSDIKLARIARAEQGLKVTALEERLDRHISHSGSEIKQIQYRVGIMGTQIHEKMPNVQIPEWRDSG
jgi:hypothetical protein